MAPAGRVDGQGSMVQVHAKGTLSENGKVGKVIAGWDGGCLGMKQGEVRRLEIPLSNET
ncbi:hypothetical protein T484DRAFT_1793037 [Baffinella frigidus]|nr:hypothetical protein T484DRAFT_1793037 [Cryptophyta sp. CCMP2293]